MKWAYGGLLGLLLAALAAACGSASGGGPGQGRLLVSAASDLTFALREVGELFEGETGIGLDFNFGSTGQLAQQIRQGAPVDVFLAADVAFVEELAGQGRVSAGTVAVYARGRIALWTRADSALRLQSVQDLVRPEVTRIAIANPDHAPYGIAAREALQAAGVWDVARPKLVLGENIRQTLSYAETGNVNVAIVALSLSVHSSGRWVLIPEELHRPIDQGLAIVEGTRRAREARRFVEFILGEKGRAILDKYGFTFPEKEPAR